MTWSPLPTPSSSEEIRALEARTGLPLQSSYGQFLTAIGPLDTNSFQFLPPSEVEPASTVWFAAAMRESDVELSKRMLRVAEYGGEDPMVLDTETGRCCLCSHDPVGFSDYLESFDDLVRLAFLFLPTGYYGWPDRAVDQLVEEAQLEMFGTDL